MYVSLTDLFKVTCKKCGSEDVYLSVEECEECGHSVSAECNNCGERYNYHDFKKRK